MSLAAEMAYGLAQLINVQGGTITYTNVTTQSGANPAPNPPTMLNVTLNGTFDSGATSLNMTGEIIVGRLMPGDSFTIEGDPTVYEVETEIVSPTNDNTLTGVSISPALAQNETADAAVTFTAFAAQTTLLALITDFPAHLINGTSIQSKDHRVRFLASALTGPDPQIGDQVTMPDGLVQSVIRISHLETQGVHYGWALQVRA